jgi:hypothetical protein
MHPAIAARDFDVIQGRPAKKAEAMMRDFMRSGGKVEWHELADTAAEATFSHPQGGSLRLRWDMDRAKKAELGSKDMWRKYPRQMLRARLISEGVRTVFPLATSGMYVPEEVRDIDDRPMTDVTPKPSAQAKLDALAGETPNAKPMTPDEQEAFLNHSSTVPGAKPSGAPLYEFDPLDGSDAKDLTGSDWLVQAEIALNSHEEPAAFWKANEPTFYRIQGAAQNAGAKKGVTACSRIADLAHSVLG